MLLLLEGSVSFFLPLLDLFPLIEADLLLAFLLGLPQEFGLVLPVQKQPEPAQELILVVDALLESHHLGDGGFIGEAVMQLPPVHYGRQGRDLLGRLYLD